MSCESGDLRFYINDQYQAGISGNVDWQKKSYTFSGSGTKTLKWVYSRNSSGSGGQNCGWVDGLVIGSDVLVPPPDGDYSEVLDCDLKFTSSGSGEYDTWSAYSGSVVEYYLDGDYLQFYIDDTRKDQISGEVGWQEKSYSVTAGIHTLTWRYAKDSSEEAGDDCGWVDFVQWTGPSPAQDPSNWQEIAYKHDVIGRRVEKKVDGYSTRYVYDGPHVIAEYDGNNNLLRKYVYGPCIDEPICMIEVADSNATYYYHYDALGSVVALSDSSGDTVQTYEYSVYGEVAVEDANHPNPYMFAGGRFDIEIGLYYNRARYYNPFVGRFLQTDPIGYGAGMNLYAYCGNGPLNFVDPSGLVPYEVSADIPLQTIWHEASVIAHGVYVKNDKNSQHKSDVQGFLDESNFSEKFPGVTLESVTYSGTSKEGTYHCVFEVPDNYENMTIVIDEEVEGIPILVVKTGHWYKLNTKKVRILDWRLVGMLNDPKYYGGSDTGKYLVMGIAGEGFSLTFGAAAAHYWRQIGTWKCPAFLVPGAASGVLQLVGVYGFYKVIFDPGGNVPNFAKWDSYGEYLNAYDYEKGTPFERYEAYKKQYNL